MQDEVTQQEVAPEPAPARNVMGVVGLTVSIVGVCLCGLWILTVPGLIISLIALRKPPRTAAIIGAVLGALGILGFLFIFPALMLPALATARENAGIQVTANQIRRIQSLSVAAFYDDTGAYPSSFDELVQGEYLRADMTLDSWDNEIRFEGGVHAKPTITSAGPDGEFGNEDDIAE